MIIKSIKLKNFRNYDLLDLTLGEDVNIFYGKNAQGKTNILESVYLCATTKSHRGAKDREMIQYDKDESHIEVDVEKKGVPFKIDMHLKKSGSKGVAINKIPIRRASELFGIINIIIFSPEDLYIIKNGPGERRKFINMELSQLDKIYLKNISDYNKILEQRNKLLKDITIRNDLIDTLNVWDEQLITYGNNVIESRRKFIEQINDIIGDIHKKLTGNAENLVLLYEPKVESKDFEEAVKRSRDQDIRTRTTNVGPHRDDICFMIDGQDISIYGSQGQQRTAALSLKISEIELVKKLINDTPVLLLDDVLSELDKDRQNYLLDSISDIQTLVTCTGLDEFVNRRLSINNTLHVEKGHVTQD